MQKLTEKEYFNPDKAFNYKSFQVPKELFLNEEYKAISLEAKMLYSIIRDRAYLSQRNGWIKDNHLYLIITREEVQELLGISYKTVIKAFKELKGCGLIEEKRQGTHKPNLIFPLEIRHDDKLDFLICKNYISRHVKNTHLDVKKLHTKYTNNKYTNITNNKGKKYLDYEQREYTKQVLEALYVNNKL